MKTKIVAILFAVVLLIPGLAFAQEKKGTVADYDEGSRMLTIKGKDWEQKAKVRSADAERKEVLKKGAKVTVEFDDRGGGDVRVKSIEPR